MRKRKKCGGGGKQRKCGGVGGGKQYNQCGAGVKKTIKMWWCWWRWRGKTIE